MKFLKDNHFYLQALGIVALFIALLIVIWVGSGGPASEAQVQNASNTRTAIASTEQFLLKPPPTNTPLFILPTFEGETIEPGSTPTSGVAPAAPATSTPFPSPAPSATPLPQTEVAQLPAATAAGVSSHQPTKAPPLIPRTGLDSQDPVGFAQWYFGRVWRERDYQNLWDNYLTPSFKENVGSGSFADYVQWWDSVQRVDLNSVDVIQNNGTTAWIRVNVTIHMKDGNVTTNQTFDYDLLYDPAKKSWMFDYGNR